MWTIQVLFITITNTVGDFNLLLLLFYLLCRWLWSRKHYASTSVASTDDDCMRSVWPDKKLWELQSHCCEHWTTDSIVCSRNVICRHNIICRLSFV